MKINQILREIFANASTCIDSSNINTGSFDIGNRYWFNLFALFLLKKTRPFLVSFLRYFVFVQLLPPKHLNAV